MRYQRSIRARSFSRADRVVSHWAADDLANMVTATKVPVWTDPLGGAVATQGTSANQPTLTHNALNGRPGVYFQNSHWMQVTSPNGLLQLLNPPNSGPVSRAYSVGVVLYKDGTLSSKGVSACVLGNATNTNTGLWMPATGGISGRSTTNFIPMGASGLEVIVWTQPRILISPVTQTDGVAATYVNNTRCPRCITGVVNAGAQNIVFGSGGLVASAAMRGYILDIMFFDTELIGPDVAEFNEWAFDDRKQTLPWLGASYFVSWTGDSIPNGTGTTNTPQDTYAYQIAQGGFSYSLGLQPGQWGDYGYPSATLNAQNHIFYKHLRLLPSRMRGLNVIASHYGYRNDAGGSTYVTRQNAVFGGWQQWCPGTKISVATATAYTPSPVDRNQFNSAYDTYISPFVGQPISILAGYVPIHLSTEMGPDGIYTTFPARFQTDQIHFSPTGNTYKAGYEGPVLQAIYGGATTLQVATIP